MFRNVLQQISHQNQGIKIICFLRGTSSGIVSNYIPKVKEIEPMPVDFKEHPERDLVNFPHYVSKLWPGKVRLFFIPDSYFQFFYKKTGVTGPYLFFGGLLTFLMQKEIWVMEHTFQHIPPFLFVFYLMHRYVFRPFTVSLDEEMHADIDKQNSAKFEDIKLNQDYIAMEKQRQEMLPVMIQFLTEAKKENIFLQLEAAYRQRLKQAHAEVKRRLDYMVEVEESKTRLQQSYMVQWIVNQVKSSITPQQEKATLQQCISDLKLLAVKA